MTNDYILPPGVRLLIQVHWHTHDCPSAYVSLHAPAPDYAALDVRTFNLPEGTGRVLAALAGPGACPEGVAGWLVELSTAAEAVMLGARALSGGAS
jgi:hypothetical protein